MKTFDQEFHALQYETLAAVTTIRNHYQVGVLKPEIAMDKISSILDNYEEKLFKLMDQATTDVKQ